MRDQNEARTHEALDRMEAAALPAYQGSDISRLIRQLMQRQRDVHNQLHAVVRELDQVAALLREPTDRPSVQATAAREQIALSFADGARRIDAARATLIQSTEQLEYLRYKFL